MELKQKKNKINLRQKINFNIYVYVIGDNQFPSITYVNLPEVTGALRPMSSVEAYTSYYQKLSEMFSQIK